MVKISDIELPVIFKNQLLFKAGNWNHLSFSNDTVYNSVKNTKWTALNKRLYFKHENSNDLSHWKGKVENLKEVMNGNVAEIRGDVQIWDPVEALQMAYGDKPHAISADIEYNDNGTMFFTGFALESDPGIRDNNMFLSDVVKNELNGYYHAKFNNLIDTKQVENPTNVPVNEIEKNQVDNQSAERRLIENKLSDNMTENQKSVPTQPSNNLDIAKQIVERIDTLETAMKQELAKAETPTTKEVPKEPIVENKVEPKVEPKQEVNQGTVVDKQLTSSLPQGELDAKLVESIASQVVEKIKPSLVPQPMTINEFQGSYVDTQEETVNKLTESLAKI